jgi:prevent-host-death family protein
MTKISATQFRENFSEFYNSVKFTGKPIVITNHGDGSIALVRVEDIYPEVSAAEISLMNTRSKAFDDIKNDDDLYV